MQKTQNNSDKVTMATKELTIMFISKTCLFLNLFRRLFDRQKGFFWAMHRHA